MNVYSSRRSLSPSSSPRGSPKPSPRPEHKREHSRSETHLSTTSYRESQTSTPNKNDSTQNVKSSFFFVHNYEYDAKIMYLYLVRSSKRNSQIGIIVIC